MLLYQTGHVRKETLVIALRKQRQTVLYQLSHSDQNGKFYHLVSAYVMKLRFCYSKSQFRVL